MDRQVAGMEVDQPEAQELEVADLRTFLCMVKLAVKIGIARTICTAGSLLLVLEVALVTMIIKIGLLAAVVEKMEKMERVIVELKEECRQAVGAILMFQLIRDLVLEDQTESIVTTLEVVEAGMVAVHLIVKTFIGEEVALEVQVTYITHQLPKIIRVDVCWTVHFICLIPKRLLETPNSQM